MLLVTITCALVVPETSTVDPHAEDVDGTPSRS